MKKSVKGAGGVTEVGYVLMLVSSCLLNECFLL